MIRYLRGELFLKEIAGLVVVIVSKTVFLVNPWRARQRFLEPIRPAAFSYRQVTAHRKSFVGRSGDDRW